QENNKLMEASPYVCTTTVRIPKNYIVISQRAFQNLTPDMQANLRAAARTIETNSWARWDQAEAENRKRILAQGGRTCELSPAVEAEFRAISNRLFAAYCPQCTAPNCNYPEKICDKDKEKCCPINQ